jgi:hypothetical protein
MKLGQKIGDRAVDENRTMLYHQIHGYYRSPCRFYVRKSLQAVAEMKSGHFGAPSICPDPNKEICKRKGIWEEIIK